MEIWPEIPYEPWRDSLQTLHRWVQVVGKIKLTRSPWLNHCWGSTLQVGPRGLTTSVVYEGERAFELTLDLMDHVLKIESSDRNEIRLPLVAESVASFHRRCFAALIECGFRPEICEKPNELPDATPLHLDEDHRSYDPEAAARFLRALQQADRLMKIFRSRFAGKASPVHFFWGSFDLAVTRFSGRPAPEHPGGLPNLPDRIAREAYSHEVSSCGFWPGNDRLPYPAFYSYAYPSPPQFEKARIQSGHAFFQDDLNEFILPYECVRQSDDPDRLVLEFFESTYAAAARLANWDHAKFEPTGHLKEIQKQWPPHHKKWRRTFDLHKDFLH